MTFPSPDEDSSSTALSGFWQGNKNLKLFNNGQVKITLRNTEMNLSEDTATTWKYAHFQ